MTPADLHSDCVRCLGDIFEDNADLTPHDLKALFSASLAHVLGLPATHRSHVKHRFTSRQVRALVHPILEKRLMGHDVQLLMSEIDTAMALAMATVVER